VQSLLLITDEHRQVELWFPVNLISGGTTAKIMVAAKDNFLGKYIYKDTLNRNLAAVIYRVSLLCFLFPMGKTFQFFLSSVVIAWLIYIAQPAFMFD